MQCRRSPQAYFISEWPSSIPECGDVLKKSLKGLLRKYDSDLPLLHFLLESDSETLFDSSVFEKALDLKPIPAKRVSFRRLTEALGFIEESERILKQARSLSGQLNMLLPAGIPPVVYEPLHYILSRIVVGDLLKKEWEYSASPHWLDRLLTLHMISEITGSKPWWLQAVHLATENWRSTDPNDLGRQIVGEVSQTMNVAMSSIVVNLMEKISRAKRSRFADLARYVPERESQGNHLFRAMSYSIRESFIPAFRRLGFKRVLVFSSGAKKHKMPAGQNSEEILLKTPKPNRVQEWIVRHDNDSLPQQAVPLREQRTSLRLSLLNRADGSWMTLVNLNSSPPTPAKEPNWIVHEERRARKTTETTEREAIVLSMGWAFPCDGKTRELMLSRLGVSPYNGNAAAKSLLKRGALTLQYLPSAELLGLRDEVLAVVSGAREQLLLARRQIEAGTPRCESSISSDREKLFLRIRVPQVRGELLATQLSREFPEKGLEVMVSTTKSSSRRRFSALAHLLARPHK